MRRKHESEKQFDTVETMCRIRAALNEELEGRNFEEVRQYLREQLPDARAERLRRSAGPINDTVGKFAAPHRPGRPTSD